MTTLRLYFSGERAGPKFERSVFRQGNLVRAAMRDAAKETAEKIETEGAADIASAGNFGERWTRGLHAKVTEGGGNIRIAVTHEVPYFMVHQKGATIHAKNSSGLLWIPLSFASDAQGVWPSAFPGNLVRVPKEGNARKDGGRPLLVSTDDGQPKYFGIESVTIPKRFHVIEIATRLAREFGDRFRKKIGK